MPDKSIQYDRNEEAVHSESFVFDMPYPVSELTSTSQNSLVINDRLCGLYLYHANCLELMDLIAEKHPHLTFDNRDM